MQSQSKLFPPRVRITPPFSPERTGAAGSGVFASLGAVTGLGAILASSCCVIPLTLAGLGVGTGALVLLAPLASFRVPLIGTTALAIGIGWWLFFRARGRGCDAQAGCAAPIRGSGRLAALSLATGLLTLAAASPYIEPVLLRLMRSG